jgi:hypothetical protein
VNFHKVFPLQHVDDRRTTPCAQEAAS